jgi:putative flippase GtrA
LIKMIRALFIRLWSIQLLRFLMVGGVNTIFGYTVFAGLILLHLHYVIAALIAQICGVLFNFKTTGTLVFKNKNNRLIVRFIGVYVFTYLLNIGLLKLFDLYGVKSLIAGAIILIPVALVSFALNKIFVFEVLKIKQT